MRHEVNFEGSSYPVIWNDVVFEHGIWQERVFIPGHHPDFGYQIKGETGPETVQFISVPDSLVDKRILVNGKPNDILRDLVRPEFQHLLPPMPDSGMTELHPNQDDELIPEDHNSNLVG